MATEEFKPLSLIEELKLPQEELPSYYNQKRKYLFDQGKAIRGMKWREILHPVLLQLVKADRTLINRQTLTILNDKSTKSNKPVIYAITHIGMFDYQIVSEALKEHAIPFAGDPETTYRSFEGLMFQLNGVILCDTDSKTDRFIAKESAKELLIKYKKNLMIYPEGVWNLTASRPVMDFFPGIIDIAEETGCEIIPVAIEQYDKDFIINIGSNFIVDPYHGTNRKEYIYDKKNKLRDIMATLKWQIWESVPKLDRSSIVDPESIYEEFVDKRLNEWVDSKTKKPHYTRQLIADREFKAKNIAFPNDVYSFMRNLKISRENAFLFREAIGVPSTINKEIEEMLNKELEKGRRL